MLCLSLHLRETVYHVDLSTGGRCRATRSTLPTHPTRTRVWRRRARRRKLNNTMPFLRDIYQTFTSPQQVCPRCAGLFDQHKLHMFCTCGSICVRASDRCARCVMKRCCDTRARPCVLTCFQPAQYPPRSTLPSAERAGKGECSETHRHEQYLVVHGNTKGLCTRPLAIALIPSKTMPVHEP